MTGLDTPGAGGRDGGVRPGSVEADPAIVAEVRSRLAREGGAVSSERVAAVLAEYGAVLGSQARAELGGVLRAELWGAGALQALVDDPEVTDVLVNGPDQVWVERAGRLERTSVHLGDVRRVRELAVRLAAAGGARLDDASPTVDARLPDGTRLHAVLPPLADGCALICLRVLRRHELTLDGLVRAGSVTPDLATVLRALVAARANFLVSGATGTGKTTLLAALLELVPHDERIVCIEESGELTPRHPHVVHLLARRPNVENAGGVGLADLVRESLRMRPDRIVLGECRGAEVREVLTALNTGHEGGCATVHANTAADVAARLEALGALAGMSPSALAAQASSALDAVLHLRRDGARRYLAEVGVVGRAGTDDGRLVVTTAVGVSADGHAARGAGWERLAERLGWTP